VGVVQSSVTSEVISFILSFKRGLDQYGSWGPKFGDYVKCNSTSVPFHIVTGKRGGWQA
jgi:hypothetical protein